MKCQVILALLPVLVLAALESPAKKVVLFIQELQEEIKADMAKEKASFETFAAWCDETTKAAKENIKTAEETIESCSRRIEALSGFEAAGGAEIANAEKNVVETGKRLEEAAAMRAKEKKAFEASKEELEASLQAMTEALKEFSEDGSAFLQRRSQGTGALRRMLQLNIVSSKVPIQDLQLLSAFAQSGDLSLLQGAGVGGGMGQVIGVLKTTKTDFEEELKELLAEEEEKSKVHGKMMGSLQKEQSDLETFLLEQKSNNGNSAKELSEKKTLRDETTAQLKADKELLTSTEDTCKEKTYQFNDRKKLRDQELKGVKQALELLTSDDAQAAFQGSAAVSFAQLRQLRHHDQRREKALQALQATATKSRSLAVAKIAAELSTGGVFRKVIMQIDTQIGALQAEEKEDVDHKDRCLKQMAASDETLSLLEDSITKAGVKIGRMEGQAGEIQKELDTLKAEIKETGKDIVDRQESRDKEREEHLAALKHDQDALVLMDNAMEQITKFFKDNKVDVGASLIQRHQSGKPGAMPDAGFEDADYQGQKDSTKGLVAMMQMVKEDLEAEIENGKAQDTENQALYQKDYAALKELLDTQKQQQLTATKALADLKEDTEGKKEFQDDKAAEKKSEEKNKENLHADCAWVKTNFDSRREKRQAEIQGLVEAKGLLAAV
ncbi:unnamed protein product [Effrenium voratum]|uniref:Uncharacterized protein n=1 Tax=Effrenium voratum TaxID=2562239 RepID=A0AA36MZ95_9DINO|nr:unnamed protein product [Effrenium voratum]CAJ1418384.1 unnamed protein product [Effrenium voratum]